MSSFLRQASGRLFNCDSCNGSSYARLCRGDLTHRRGVEKAVATISPSRRWSPAKFIASHCHNPTCGQSSHVTSLSPLTERPDLTIRRSTINSTRFPIRVRVSRASSTISPRETRRRDCRTLPSVIHPFVIFLVGNQTDI